MRQKTHLFKVIMYTNVIFRNVYRYYYYNMKTTYSILNILQFYSKAEHA